MELIRLLLGLPPGTIERERLKHLVSEMASRMVVLSEQGENKEALEAAERCIPLCKRLVAVYDIARIHNNAGLLCERLSRWRPALSHYHKALRIWRRLDDNHGQAVARLGKGRVLFHVQEQDRARHELEKARQLFKHTGETEYMINVLEHLISAYDDLGMIKEERGCAKELVSLCQGQKDKKAQINALHQLGVADRKDEDYEMSIIHLRQADKICRSVDDDEKRISLIDDLAEAYVGRELFTEAIQIVKEGLTLAKHRGNRIWLGKLLNRQGLILTLWSKFGEAEKSFHKAIEFLDSIPPAHRTRAEGKLLFNLAALYRRQGDYDKAEEFADRAARIFHSIRDFAGELQAMRIATKSRKQKVSS